MEASYTAYIWGEKEGIAWQALESDSWSIHCLAKFFIGYSAALGCRVQTVIWQTEEKNKTANKKNITMAACGDNGILMEW